MGREGAMNFLVVENASKRFGGVRAVSEVSFQVGQGEILGLIGPNGAGKTTLFNLIAGAFPSDTGRIVFDGLDINGQPPHAICRQGIARTFQITRPFLNMTCGENVLVAVANRAKPAAPHERDELVASCLSFVGLADRGRTLAKDLNLIDKKRLELARALGTGPRLILLDEVLGGLSSLEMDEALKLVRDIRDRQGVTILWIEHVMGAIMSLCERVLVLDQGRFIFEGKPEEVVKNPAVVQAYLGEADA